MKPFDFWDQNADLASKRQGWLLTNDWSGRVTIAKLDDPQAWVDSGWPIAPPQPFKDDRAAWDYVVDKARAGDRVAMLAVWLQGYDIAKNMDMEPPAALLRHSSEIG
jgi:hypothetical protein